MWIFQVYALEGGELLTRCVLARNRRDAAIAAVEVVKRFHPAAKVTRIVPVLDVSDVRRLHDSGLIQALATIDQCGLVSMHLFQHVQKLIELCRQMMQLQERQ